jgi:hypothetical protein
MRFKAAFAVGIAAGYVLGARAGRKRYDQIARISKSIWRQPVVQHTADAVQTQATNLGAQARQAVQQRAGSMSHDLMDKVTSKLPSGVSSKIRHTVHLDGSYSGTHS